MHICTVNKDKPKQPNYLLKMKKITFILFALIAGTTFAQDNVTTAEVNAEIVSPISITSDQPLEFGRIAADPSSAQTITIDLNGDRNIIAGVTLAGGNTPSMARFNIVAANTSYSITVTPPTTLVDAADKNPMTLSLTPSLTAPQTGNKTLTVGGSIVVPAAHPAGAYSGSVEVTVAYQ